MKDNRLEFFGRRRGMSPLRLEPGQTGVEAAIANNLAEAAKAKEELAHQLTLRMLLMARKLEWIGPKDEPTFHELLFTVDAKLGIVDPDAPAPGAHQ